MRSLVCTTSGATDIAIIITIIITITVGGRVGAALVRQRRMVALLTPQSGRLPMEALKRQQPQNLQATVAQALSAHQLLTVPLVAAAAPPPRQQNSGRLVVRHHAACAQS